MNKGLLKNKSLIKLNKLIIIQVVSLLLLVLFACNVHAETVLGISELTKTGDYKNKKIETSSNTNNSITVTTSKGNGEEVSKDQAIKIEVNSITGVKRIEAFLYDAQTDKIVNSNFYVDSNAQSKNPVMSIVTPSFPTSRLLLKINVTNETETKTFERIYQMQESILTLYFNNLSQTKITGSELFFYADASNSSVPIKELTYTLKENNSVLNSGSIKLKNDSYYINESGEIIYDKTYVKEGNATFETLYNNSRINAKIILPNKQSNVTLHVETRDILNNVCVKDKTFDIKTLDITFSNETTKKDLKVGETIKVKAISTHGFGLYKLELIEQDANGIVLQKNNETSKYTNGSWSLECTLGAVDSNVINVIAIATDIEGNTKSYGPITFNVALDKVDITPIFKLSSEPKLMGSSEVVSVTSNSGILFTQLLVRITDKNGNTIKDTNGTQKISQVSSSVGKTNLETTIYYPETSLDTVYFVFEAKDIYGNTYSGGTDFNNMSQVYKKGPISIYSNKINISATPQTGIINSNSKIKLTAKVDIVKNPITKLDYVYYNEDAKKITSGAVLPSTMPILYMLSSKEVIKGQVKITKDTSEIIRITPEKLSSLKKDGYTLYASRPEWDGSKFIANAYYLKDDSGEILNEDYSLYSVTNGKEILGYGSYKTQGVIANQVIDGPSKNANQITLCVKATDKEGKSKTTQYNYYQNESNIEVVALPDGGKVHNDGYLRILARTNDERSMSLLSYELYDGTSIVKKGTINEKNNKGEIILDLTVPSITKNNQIDLVIEAIDEDNNIKKEKYTFDVLSHIDVTDKDNDDYVGVASRLMGGANEYVVVYRDETGKLIEAVLNKQSKEGNDYFYLNVKDMEMLSFAKINEQVVKNNLPKIPKIENIEKILVRLNLYYATTCNIRGTNEYVDVIRNLIVTNKDNNYLGLKNNTINLGNKIIVSDLFDLDMKNEILEKAQKQDVIEVDLNNMGMNDKIVKVYNPEKIEDGKLKEKKIDATIKFNNDYLKSNSKFTLSDVEDGKLITLSHSKIENLVHLIMNKYVIDNYSIKVEDNSTHKNHTYTVDSTGNIIEHCSLDCIIRNPIKTVYIYYRGKETKIELKQESIPELYVKYLATDNTYVKVGEGIEPKKNSEGKVSIKVCAKYELETLYQLAQKIEFGEIGLAFNKDYSGEGEVKTFEIESSAMWLDFDVESVITSDNKGPKVSINTQNQNNALYFNANKNRYERSSDRGSQLTFSIRDDVPLKDIKVSFKYNGTYGPYEEIANLDGLNQTFKDLKVTIPDNIQKYGGAFGIKVIATNIYGVSSNGLCYVQGKKDPIELNLFMNTTYGTNPVVKADLNNTSLINYNGTINEKVLSAIGDGKTNDTESAFRIINIYDTKWKNTNNKLNVSNMAVYYNILNDTIGLGYRLTFELDTVGYGTDTYVKEGKKYYDQIIANMKFYYLKNNKLVEIIPFEEINGTHVMCNYSNKYRQIRMELNKDTNNDNTMGLNKMTFKDNKVVNQFSYYLAPNVKFKEKDNLDGDFINPNQILVQMDIECYKYYSISSDGELVKNGQYDDSRHLYTLRENTWPNKVGQEIKNSQITSKIYQTKLRDLVSSTKGMVFWYDVDKDSIFDIKGSKAY